ncbi:MAG TPA: twin-arginine translocase TatA/TatE family subunit [Chthoniobacteraceae bacterium]|nr:twin-arginine translocase TatA/TatE family subunit [Chthoniobacteraceae bacterium]
MLATTLSSTVTLAAFGNLFGPDTLVIFLIILIFFWAKKLPELARSLGQAMREFSKAKDDFEREITRPPEAQESPKQIEPPVATSAPVTKAETDHPVTTEHPDVAVHPPETVPKH